MKGRLWSATGIGSERTLFAATATDFPGNSSAEKSLKYIVLFLR